MARKSDTTLCKTWYHCNKLRLRVINSDSDLRNRGGEGIDILTNFSKLLDGLVISRILGESALILLFFQFILTNPRVFRKTLRWSLVCQSLGAANPPTENEFDVYDWSIMDANWQDKNHFHDLRISLSNSMSHTCITCWIITVRSPVCIMYFYCEAKI